MGALSVKQKAAREAAAGRRRQTFPELNPYQQRAWITRAERRVELNEFRARAAAWSLDAYLEEVTDRPRQVMPAALIQPPNQEDAVYLREVLDELLRKEGAEGAKAFLNTCEGTERDERAARAKRARTRAHLAEWAEGVSLLR